MSVSSSLARVLLTAVLLSAVSCGGDDPEALRSPSISPIPADLDQFTLASPAFDVGEGIPDDFTCVGDGISPPLEWSGIPEGTTEMILTLLDPDAPEGVFTHWTVYGMSPSSGGLPPGETLEGASEGVNDFGDEGYGPPCPPDGESHRYIFTLAAFTEPSGLEPGAAPAEVDAVMQGATATTTLTGQYPD